MRAITRMTPAFVLAAACLIAIGPARADEPAIECHGEKAVCQTLVAGEKELASMLVSGDVGVVQRLFADDAIWTLANGVRWTKQEAVVALRRAPKMISSRLLRASVYQHGTVAIVSWSESWRDPGKAREQQSFGTDTWVVRDKGWQIIASQEARRPPTP